jgi:hypothetical protein
MPKIDNLGYHDMVSMCHCWDQLSEIFKNIITVIGVVGKTSIENYNGIYIFKIDREDIFKINIKGHGIEINRYIPIILDEVSSFYKKHEMTKIRL